MSEQNKSVDLCGGCFYEKEDGTIAYIYGFNGVNKDGFDIVMASEWVDNFYEIPENECANWKVRKDLNQFPQDPDFRLPYSFDLHWDIKWASEILDDWGCKTDDPLFLELLHDSKEDILKAFQRMDMADDAPESLMQFLTGENHSLLDILPPELTKECGKYDPKLSNIAIDYIKELQKKNKELEEIIADMQDTVQASESW